MNPFPKTALAATVLLGLFSGKIPASLPSQRSKRRTLKGNILLSALLAGSLIATPALASPRSLCELEAKPTTTMATGAGLGGLAGGGAGTVVGLAACSGFLGLIFFDMGLSYAACVAAVTTTGATAGTIIGTNAAETANIRSEQDCQNLPDN